MENTVKRPRWSKLEIRRAKKALKEHKGNQKEAALAVYQELERPLPSTIRTMWKLAQKHPSLRRKAFRGESGKIVTMKRTPVEKQEDVPPSINPASIQILKRIEVHADHIRIYL